MSYVEATLKSLWPLELKNLHSAEFRCPACGWEGYGIEALIRMDDVVRCSWCGEPVEEKQ